MFCCPAHVRFLLMLDSVAMERGLQHQRGCFTMFVWSKVMQKGTPAPSLIGCSLYNSACHRLTPAHRCSNGWPAVTWQFDDPIGCACLQEWECVSLFFAPISFDCCQFLRCCNEIDATYLGTRRTQRIACCTCFLMLAFSKCSRAKIKLCLFHVVFHI